MSTEHSNSRRAFLRTLTSTAGGAVAFAAAPSVAQAAPKTEAEKPTDAKPESKGYQRTEHVETYYQLADF